MKGIYNDLKLSVYRDLFHKLKVLIIGSGAVGTYLMEYLSKLGVSPDTVDKDRFTFENAAKHSCLVRTPEDVGRNKAECTSQRVLPLLDEGCLSNGIDTDLCNLGPEAFSDYDAVFVAVDNYAAKVLLNDLIRQLPEEQRPVVLMSGTYGETASSVITDNKKFCLNCLINEQWMKDASIRTSCGRPQTRTIDGKTEIIRTSNLASSMAAHLSTEQFRGFILKYPDVMNCRLTYTAYPYLQLSKEKPIAKDCCSGCKVQPPEKKIALAGTVLTKTLKQALKEIEGILGTTEFEMSVYRLNYKNIVYDGFVTDEICHSCGKTIRVMKHEGRMYDEDLMCHECRSKKAHIMEELVGNPDSVLHAFTKDCDETIINMTLYELGFPLGAHIEVVEKNGAIDFLDSEKIEKTVFYCEEDHKQMHSIHKL